MRVTKLRTLAGSDIHMDRVTMIPIFVYDVLLCVVMAKLYELLLSNY